MQYFIALCLALIMTSASALEAVEVSNLESGYSLNDHVEFAVDELGEFTPEQLMSADQEWNVHNKETLSFGYTSFAYWLRFKVTNSTAQDISHLLEIAYPVLDDVRMYIYDADANLITLHQLGDKIPFTLRQVQHRHFVVPLDVAGNQEQTWLLRIETSSAMQIPMTIWPEREFFIQDQSRLMGLGLYYGIMFIMVLYNLFVFLLSLIHI